MWPWGQETFTATFPEDITALKPSQWGKGTVELHQKEAHIFEATNMRFVCAAVTHFTKLSGCVDSEHEKILQLIWFNWLCPLPLRPSRSNYDLGPVGRSASPHEGAAGLVLFSLPAMPARATIWGLARDFINGYILHNIASNQGTQIR